MLGKPGLRDAERTLTRLLSQRADADRRASIDPDERVMYRLVQGNHRRDGRRVMPGEIVELTMRQAEASMDVSRVVRRRALIAALSFDRVVECGADEIQ
jgi:hypothetical protein